MKIYLQLILFTLIVGMSVPAMGATVTVTSSVNWSALTGGSGPGGLPGPTDQVIVKNNVTLTVDIATATCASIQLGNADVVPIGDGTLSFTASGKVTVSGTVTMGVALMKSGNINMTGGGILSCGQIVYALGSWNAGSGEVIITGSTTLSWWFFIYNKLTIGGSANTVTLGSNILIKSQLWVMSGTTLISGSYSVEMQGNWKNEGTFNPGTSIVKFTSGPNTNVVTGPLTLNKLLIDKYAGNVSTTNVTVNDTLTLTNGLFSLPDTSVFTIGGAVIGGSASSYIAGTVARIFSSVPDSFTFPVGSTGFAPVTVKATAGSDTFKVKTNYGAPATVINPNYTLNRSWTLTPGSVTQADLIFNYPSADVRGTEGNYTASRWDGTAWEIVPSSIIATNTIQASGVSSFSDWTVGEPLYLPIVLNSFRAVSSGERSVMVDWSTITETNSLGFFVERRDNQISIFATVSELIAAAGTSLEPHDYSFTDNDVFPGEYFYRLKQVDLDGSITYSGEIHILIGGVLGVNDRKPLVFNLYQNYPNPFNPATTIAFQIPRNSVVSLNVYNIIGQEVATILNNVQLNAGEHVREFNANALASGIYFYRLVANRGEFQTVRQMVLLK